MWIAAVITFLVAGVIHQMVKPPPSRRCGSVNGPPVTSPRVRLSDGRYLAYKVRGAAKENAKHKVIINSGFSASKETYIPVSDVRSLPKIHANLLEFCGRTCICFENSAYDLFFFLFYKSDFVLHMLASLLLSSIFVY